MTQLGPKQKYAEDQSFDNTEHCEEGKFVRDLSPHHEGLRQRCTDCSTDNERKEASPVQPRVKVDERYSEHHHRCEAKKRVQQNDPGPVAERHGACVANR
jgi:hypothetical protein